MNSFHSRREFSGCVTGRSTISLLGLELSEPCIKFCIRVGTLIISTYQLHAFICSTRHGALLPYTSTRGFSATSIDCKTQYYSIQLTNSRPCSSATAESVHGSATLQLWRLGLRTRLIYSYGGVTSAIMIALFISTAID